MMGTACIVDRMRATVAKCCFWVMNDLSSDAKIVLQKWTMSLDKVECATENDGEWYLFV